MEKLSKYTLCPHESKANKLKTSSSYIIPGFFTPKECQELISMCEEAKFNPLPEERYDPSLRNNIRPDCSKRFFSTSQTKSSYKTAELLKHGIYLASILPYDFASMNLVNFLLVMLMVRNFLQMVE